MEKTFTQSEIFDALLNHCVNMYILPKTCEEDKEKKEKYEEMAVLYKNAAMYFVSEYFFDGEDLSDKLVEELEKLLEEGDE